MFSDPLALLAATPAAVVAVVFLAGLLEYVFPPFWGDTLMLAGCFLAGAHKASAVAVFTAAVVGSCLGAVLAYALGRNLGRAALALAGRSEQARKLLARAERLHQDHGCRILALNRFIPGVRAFFLPLAGVSRAPLRQVVLWASVSNLAYCSLLLTVGLVVGASAPDLAAAEGPFRIAITVGAAVAVALVVAFALSHWRTRSRSVAPAVPTA